MVEKEFGLIEEETVAPAAVEDSPTAGMADPVMLTGGHLGGTIVDVTWPVGSEFQFQYGTEAIIYRRLTDDRNPETIDQAVYVGKL